MSSFSSSIPGLTRFDIAIIGGGVIGLMSAYYLNQQGYSVCVIDKADIGSGSSYGNCGLITPSMALPLNRIGLVKKALKGLLDPDSAFSLPLTPNRELIRWGIGFLANMTNTKVSNALMARLNLLRSSRALYQTLITSHNWSCNWQTKGVLYISEKNESIDILQSDLDSLSPYGASYEALSKHQIKIFEPSLQGELAGGVWCPDDAHLHPEQLCKELGSTIETMGVNLFENETVIGFEHNHRSIERIKTDTRCIKVNKTIIATGAWSPLMAKLLNLRIPIQPATGYSVTFNNSKDNPDRPIVHTDTSIAVTPWEKSLRVGGTMAFNGYNTQLNHQRINSIINQTAQFLHLPEPPTTLKSWLGFRPVMSNSIPLIGKSNQFNNLYYACGHDMLGMSMAPATGKLISEILTQQKPHIDTRYYFDHIL